MGSKERVRPWRDQESATDHRIELRNRSLTRIPENKLDKTTHLDVASNSISDLSGVEKARGLQVLTIFNNHLTSLASCRQNRCLEEIYAQSNTIATLEDLPDLRSMTTFRIDHNPLRSLGGVEHFRNLRYLNASYTPIQSTKGIGFLKQLKILRLEHCKLTHLGDIVLCGALEELILTGNKLMELSNLSALNNLQYLSLDSCGILDSHIQNIDVHSGIHQISLADNQLTTISCICKTFPNLRVLALQNNPVTNVQNHIDAVAIQTYEKRLSELSSLCNLQDCTLIDTTDCFVTKHLLHKASTMLPELLYLDNQHVRGVEYEDTLGDSSPDAINVEKLLAPAPIETIVGNEELETGATKLRYHFEHSKKTLNEYTNAPATHNSASTIMNQFDQERTERRHIMKQLSQRLQNSNPKIQSEDVSDNGIKHSVPESTSTKPNVTKKKNFAGPSDIGEELKAAIKSVNMVPELEKIRSARLDRLEQLDDALYSAETADRLLNEYAKHRTSFQQQRASIFMETSLAETASTSAKSDTQVTNDHMKKQSDEFSNSVKDTHAHDINAYTDQHQLGINKDTVNANSTSSSPYTFVEVDNSLPNEVSDTDIDGQIRVLMQSVFSEANASMRGLDTTSSQTYHESGSTLPKSSNDTVGLRKYLLAARKGKPETPKGRARPASSWNPSSSSKDGLLSQRPATAGPRRGTLAAALQYARTGTNGSLNLSVDQHQSDVTHTPTSQSSHHNDNQSIDNPTLVRRPSSALPASTSIKALKPVHSAKIESNFDRDAPVSGRSKISAQRFISRKSSKSKL